MASADFEAFICIPDALLTGAQEKSFEELRVSDYIQAFTTTGRPPVPVPELPADPTARAALNLPLLFRPSHPPKPKLDESSLGEIQLWESTRHDQDQLQSIVASEKYSEWSPEELRHYAYLKGNTTLPPQYQNHPSVVGTSQASTSTSTTRSPLHSSTLFGNTPGSSNLGTTYTNGEQFQSITAADDKKDHSFEEHRIAYIFAGRDMTSGEITSTQASNPIVAPRPPSASAPLPTAPGTLASPTSSPWAPRPGTFRPF